MIARIRKVFATNDSGATAVEYGLLVALIAAVIVAAVLALGGTLTGVFEDVNTDLEGAVA